MRVYRGTTSQSPDPLIEGVEGSGHAPAYRGTAYVVFDNLALEKFGNRLPQLTFEVFRRVSSSAGDSLETLPRAVTMIPGAGERTYDTKVQKRDLGGGSTTPENDSAGRSTSDWSVALDDLKASLPNVDTVFLVVGWFGDDLRCGSCTIRPKVEVANKVTTPDAWMVHGLALSARFAPVPAIHRKCRREHLADRFTDAVDEYKSGAVSATRLAGYSERTSDLRLALVMDQVQAQSIADRALVEAWVARETAQLALPPSRIALDPGDVIDLAINGRSRSFRPTRVLDKGACEAEAILSGGTNSLALGTPDGDWEIIQFCNAVLIGPGRYRLSRLLRGRLGTEHRIASHPIGSRFVLLNEAVAKIDGKPAERLAARFYAYGPQALDIADPAWQQTTFAAKAVVRMPWSPVQIAGARNGGGDLTITWVRRTRLSGVWADGVDVPLNEESERYEVDVMNGATVVRTIAATTPTACYSAAQQVADFGAAQSSVSLRVYQLSASVGHGWPGAAII